MRLWSATTATRKKERIADLEKLVAGAQADANHAELNLRGTLQTQLTQKKYRASPVASSLGWKSYG